MYLCITEFKFNTFITERHSMPTVQHSGTHLPAFFKNIYIHFHFVKMLLFYFLNCLQKREIISYLRACRISSLAIHTKLQVSNIS